jgi:hypothetical protein
MNFSNADLLGQITHFRFDRRKDHDALELMFWPEMLINERPSARGASRGGRSRQTPIDYDDTLSTSDRWKMLGTWRLLRSSLRGW